MSGAYGFVAGVLLGAGVGGHALRLVVLPEAGEEDRRAIAISACLIYGLGAALCLASSPFGLWIAVGFPLVGISAVLITKNTIDRFQIVLGVFQLVAAVVSVLMLLGKLA